jgi:WD40 repeat protein
MARVVCQVRARPDRVGFIWSEGKASFEPYHLAADELAGLRALADQAREALAQQAPSADALADIGHRLFRHLFRADTRDAGPAGEVQRWLAGLDGEGALESLEIVGDHGLLPWNVLCASSPGGSAAAGSPFWGIRYNLTTGRRASSLRPVHLLEKPAVLLVLDPRMWAAVPEVQRQHLRELAERHSLPVVESTEELAASLRSRPPDLLYVFCRADTDGLGLGDAHLSPADFGKLLQSEIPAELPWRSRLIFVNACRGDGPGTFRAGQLEALGLGGLIAIEAPLPPDVAGTFGLDFLTGFLDRGEPLGSLLQALRGRHAPLGLVYRGCCPPQLRVTWLEGEEERPADTAGAAEEPPLPDEPFRPLMPYDREDRALFVGRVHETAAIADLLDEPATRLVLLHGRYGIGKASLLRAGVLPFLEEDGIGYRALRDRSEAEENLGEEEYPVTAVRTTHDLPGQLALALTAFCARPYAFRTPTGRDVVVDLPAHLRQAVRPAGKDDASESPAAVEPDELRAALCADSSLLGRLLAAVAEALPFEPVVLIEQGEEMFTLARRREDADNRRDALAMLRHMAEGPGPGKLLVSLRTEYLGRLVSQLRAGSGVADFLLVELDEERMVAAVVQPTLDEPVPHSSEVPRSKYGFEYEDGLPESLVRRVREAARDRHESAMCLLQLLCAELVGPAGARRGTIVESDVTTIGGVDGALQRYLEGQIAATVSSRSERSKLRDLLGDLVRIQPDGTVTRDLVPEADLADVWRGTTPLPQVLERATGEDVRLLEDYPLGEGAEAHFVSLSHDALAPALAGWQHDEEVRRQHGRKVMIDWLWVVVPLAVLTAVLGWTYWRARTNLKAATDQVELQSKVLNQFKENNNLLLASLEFVQMPLYSHHLHLAEEAWQEGNTLRLRQLLLNHRQSPRTPADLRGFEWYHLWLLADRSRAALVGHRSGVTSLALAPDGKTAASASLDGTVKLWNVEQGKESATLGAFPGPAQINVGFVGGGKELVAAGADGVVRFWELDGKGPPRRGAVLTGHKGPVLSAAFTADGATLAFGGADGTVKVWDRTAAKERAALKDHTGKVLALAFAPDGKTLATAGEDHKVFLYDAAGKRLHTLKGHTGAVNALAFANGTTLVSGGAEASEFKESGAVIFWDAAAGKPQSEQSSRRFPTPILSLALSDGGKQLAAGGRDMAIYLSDLAADRPPDVLRGHLGWVGALALAADGKTLLSGSPDGTVRVWRPQGPSPRQSIVGHKGAVHALALEPEGKALASAGADGTIKLWDATTGQLQRELTAGLKAKYGPARSLAFGRLDKRLLLASAHAARGEEGPVLLWDADKGAVLHVLKGHVGGATGVAFAASGALLASSGADKVVRLWDVRKAALKRELTGHEGPVLCVAFIGDEILASGGADGTARVWDVSEGGGKAEPLVLKGQGGTIRAVAFALGDAGLRLVAACNDGTVRRWRVKDGEEFGELRGHAGPVLTCAFAPADHEIVSGGADGTLRLWDMAGGEPRFMFRGSGGPVRAVALAADGSILAAGSDDGSLRLWRAAEREPIIVHGRDPDE